MTRFLGLTAVVLSAALVGCGGGSDGWPDKPGTKVVASFPPIYCFAANVAGDDAVVRPLMTGTGPHEFNPTTDDAKLLRKAELFFLNGLDLDDEAAASLKKGSGNKGVRLVSLGDGIPAARLKKGGCNHPGHAHDHDHGTDPHVWLGLDHVPYLIDGVRDALKDRDPGHAAGYDQRAAAYKETLAKLKADGVALLKDKADRKLISFHESLGYFAEPLGLEVVGVVQPKPGVEPTQAEVKQLCDLCVEKQVRLIAVEPQFTANTSARTIKEELTRRGIPDVALVEIDPLETAAADALNAGWYEARMRANLAALAGAMK